MATQYFFAHGETPHGPYTGLEMQDLAAAGKIEPTDTVWRQGVGVPILASRVKLLFENLVVTVPAEPSGEAAPATAPADAPPEEKPRPRAVEKDRPRRVVSIKGGVLVSQDGRQVQFRKKCTTCGYEDQCRTTTVIRPGAMKVAFFCRKCRKGRVSEMFGIS